MGYRQSEIGSNRSERRGKDEKDLPVKVGEIRVYCGETLTPRSGLAFASDSEHNASTYNIVRALTPLYGTFISANSIVPV